MPIRPASGNEQARFRFKKPAPVAGLVCVNDTRYLDIIAARRIIFASTMTLDKRGTSASLVTAEFSPSAEGTDLILTHQGAFFEGADGPEMREAGWRSLLGWLIGECQQPDA